MKIFLDTASLDELRKGARWGIVDGVTTNPSLIAREGRPLAEQIRAICEIVDGDISAEVVSTGAAGMVEEARPLAKIPLTRDGISATAKPSKEGIRVTVPFKVLDSLFDHPLTDKGLAQFLKDWEKTFLKDPPNR